ncbi:E3 ubiquitin-protein ligase bre1 [Coemansia sp. Benny D115]|nr:E3 ubiquitin-protein ligase bre1 [Coemansia sp. Benny D115]
MTERKRRPEDAREIGDAQPPSSLTKKRHTAKDDGLQSLTAEFDQNAAMLDLEAIWRQMQEYKRDALRSQKRASDLEKRQSRWIKQISGVCCLWDRAVRDLDTIVNGSEAPAPESQRSAGAPDAWLDILLPSHIAATDSHPDPQAEDAFDEPAADSASTQSASAARASLEKFNASVSNVLRQLRASESGAPAIDWPAAVDRISRIRVSQAEVEGLNAKVALMSRQLHEERELLEQREGELRRALKRLDRRICPTTRPSGDTDATMSDATDTRVPEKSSPSTHGSNGTPQDADRAREASVGASGAGPAATNGALTASHMQAQQDKADLKLLAERRLAEIEEKVRENTLLTSQVDALKLQIASVPDHIVAETALYKQALASRDYYSSMAQRLQAEVERLFAEIAELKTSRAEFEGAVAAEAATQRQSLETEMQRLQNDLVRVRHHRDQIQRELEERRAQDAVEDQKSSELKLLSDVRRERMNALISENKRLLAYVAVLKGDRAAFEAYTDEDLSKTTAVADELRTKLEQVVRREKQLAGRLEALSISGAGPDTQAAASSAAADAKDAAGDGASRLSVELESVRQEASLLLARVRKYEEILGGVYVDESGRCVASADMEAAQHNELASKQQRLDALLLERDGLLKTSEMMERELQTICESFSKLEEQNTSKVWDLSLKEQAIARVIAEKSKYEEKFIGLNKDREAQRMANQALRHQNAKQLEHIKVVEEHERMLTHQLTLAGSEAQQATVAWQTAQTKLQETQQRVQELEEQAKVLDERARIAAAALNERTEALANMEHERNRAQEALELANRRASEAEKVTDQTGLAKLCADYKALLKCPTCQTNFKSHVLVRCMHVFCKQCIDSRIETRQRKCPSCSEPFGAKDVRQIYL